MKQITAILLTALLLTGCAAESAPEVAPTESLSSESTNPIATVPAEIAPAASTIHYESRFDTVTEVTLSDEEISVSPAGSSAVFMTNDIIYYEDKETYASGNPYGEGSAEEHHSQEEADAHTVINITEPGAYRFTGKLSAGQIRVDLGDNAYYDENAVVELILRDADITCTVAPAIVFLNTYECDGNWSVESAQAQVDTTAAGANLILENSNRVSGSHVAKIFKDNEDEKKLWKQDGAIYSYMSMNVFGPGSLELTADNEGLDTELHLTLNGGNIHIYSGNDGINTNEDGVSVTTINGGDLTIFAGLAEEGDGIDSNGYLVINGGNVVSCANPAADAGLDTDLGSYINGGTVVAMGSSMDWAESDSNQVTMNLQFASQQTAGSRITVTKEDGTQIFSFEEDSAYARPFSGLILSHAFFNQGENYHVYVDGQLMAYTGTDVGGFGPGGMRFPEGERPEGMEPPEGSGPEQWQDREKPEGFDPSQGFGGNGNQENKTPPEDFDGERPTLPERAIPEMPEGGFGGRGDRNRETGESRTGFYMNDKVNAFSGVTAA